MPLGDRSKHRDAIVFEGETVVLGFQPPRCAHALTLFGRVRQAGGPVRVQFEALTIEEHIVLFDALVGIPPRLPTDNCLRL